MTPLLPLPAGERAFPQGVGTSFKLTHLSPMYVDSHF